MSTTTLPTLSVYFDYLSKNRTKFSDISPNLSAAAESVNQSFQTVLSQHFKPPLDTSWGVVSALLAYGSYSSWLDSYFHAISGQVSSSWVNLRRAIEFICYCAKIYESDERSEYWRRQKDDMEARRKFSGTCSIPTAYKREKYRYLRPLMLSYDKANYYGAHGGFESLLGHYKDSSRNKINFTYPINNDGLILLIYSHSIFAGLNLLVAFDKIMSKYIHKNETYESIMYSVNESVKEAKREYYRMSNSNIIPDKVLESIGKNNTDMINILFNEYIEREEGRKNSDSNCV